MKGGKRKGAGRPKSAPTKTIALELSQIKLSRLKKQLRLIQNEYKLRLNIANKNKCSIFTKTKHKRYERLHIYLFRFKRQ